MTMLLTNASAEPKCVERVNRVPGPRRPAAQDPAPADHWRIVGSSAALQALLTDLDCVAPTTAPVLILGETGTGKDLLARRIHQRSARASGPWIQVDCTTLAPSLMEAELFGHVRGAFTGACGDRTGRVRLADGGTLFLNEVGELPLDQQGKLLRLIQDREFEPLGSSRTEKVDVRIVAATNRDLSALTAMGSFRPDLFYRLAGFPLILPPLRHRLEDLPALVEFLLRRQLAELHRPFEPLPDGVIATLQRHGWPGNIRELRSVIERACIRCTGRNLCAEDFVAPTVTIGAPRADLEAPVRSRGRTLREIEREHLRAMLALSGGVIEGRNGAAAVLGLSPSTLRFRLKRLGILATEFRKPVVDRRIEPEHRR